MLRVSNCRSIVLSVFLSLLPLCATAICDETSISKNTSHQKLDSRVKHQLRRMQRHIDSLNGFSVHAELCRDVGVGDKMQRRRKDLTIKFRRPNQLFIQSDGKRKFACDGEITRLVMAGTNNYIEQVAPPDFRKLEKLDGFRVVTGMAGRLLAPFFCEKKLSESILHGVMRSDYEAVEDGKFHKLKFYTDQLEWEVVIPDGKPTIQHFVIKSSKVDESPQVVVALRFADWEENPKAKDDEFKIDKPLDGKAFSSISEFVRSKRPKGPDPLLGRPAPHFDLKTLEGERMNLNQHLRKKIVVLDFWSAGTPASQDSLPIFARIRAKFRNKKVAFYAVNVREDSDSVREYLKLAKINIGNVLMDQNGDTAKAYGISGLPQSFIIDETGKVQVVFRGFSSDLESRFSSQLIDVINGEDVAAETLKAYGFNARFENSSADNAN